MIANRSTDSELGTITYELTRVSRVEPKAALFQIPAGYEEYFEESRAVMIDHNPYVLLEQGRLQEILSRR